MLKQIIKHAGVVALALFSIVGTVLAEEQSRPTVESIKTNMKRVADWQIEHLRDNYGRKNAKINELNAWTYGALYVGMVRWASISGDDAYYTFLNGVGEELEWDLAERIYNADDQVAGHTTDEGMLGFVQPVGAAPGNAWPDKTEVYGTGAFLAASTEVCRLIERSPKAAAQQKVQQNDGRQNNNTLIRIDHSAVHHSTKLSLVK